MNNLVLTVTKMTLSTDEQLHASVSVTFLGILYKYM